MSSVPVSFGARAAKGRVARWLLQLVLIMSFFVKGTALFLEKSIAEVLTMYASEMPCWRKSIPVLRVLVKLFCQLAKIHNRVTQWMQGPALEMVIMAVGRTLRLLERQLEREFTWSKQDTNQQQDSLVDAINIKIPWGTPHSPHHRPGDPPLSGRSPFNRWLAIV
jgi:hypothetical protein